MKGNRGKRWFNTDWGAKHFLANMAVHGHSVANLVSFNWGNFNRFDEDWVTQHPKKGEVHTLAREELPRIHFEQQDTRDWFS